MTNLRDELGNIHPAIRANYSATVELYLHFERRQYEIGSLGPGFAHPRDELPVESGEGEIETIISGKSSRWKVRFTSPVAGDSKRFTFEAI